MLIRSLPRASHATHATALLAGVLLTASLTGCGGDAEPAAEGTATTTASATSQETPAETPTDTPAETEPTTEGSEDLAPCDPESVQITPNEVFASASGRSLTVFVVSEGEPCSLADAPILELVDAEGAPLPTEVMTTEGIGTPSTELPGSVSTEIRWSTVPTGPDSDVADCVEAAGVSIGFVEGGPTTVIDEPIAACDGGSLSVSSWILNAG